MKSQVVAAAAAAALQGSTAWALLSAAAPLHHVFPVKTAGKGASADEKRLTSLNFVSF